MACAQVGTGRRVGEQQERVWARTKPVAGLTRYMALHNRHDTIEAVFCDIVLQVQDGIAENLQSKAKSAKLQLGARASPPTFFDAVCFPRHALTLTR